MRPGKNAFCYLSSESINSCPSFALVKANKIQHEHKAYKFKGQVHPDILLLCMKAEKLEKQISESLKKFGHIIKKKVIQL